MQGFEDPLNRRGFPWSHEDPRLTELYRTLGALRKERPSLQCGDLTYLAAEGGLLIYRRSYGGEDTYTLLNTGDTVLAGANLAQAELWGCMMAENPILSFFAPDLTLVFDLGKYTSLRWRAKYFEPGEFELHTSPDYFGLVKYGQIVLRDDRKDGAVVEGIQVQTGDLVITGRFLAAKLADAGVRDVYNLNCTIEAAMRKMVAEQYGRTQRTLSIKLPQAGGYTPTIQAQISRKKIRI